MCRLFSLIICICLAGGISATPYKCDAPDIPFSGNFSTRSAPQMSLWPNGIIKYEFHSSLTPANKAAVQRAIDEYHRKTCIRFVPRSPTDTAYVNIQRDGSYCGGSSENCYLGRPQSLWFGDSCDPTPAIIHEFGHVNCRGHEQDRPDRDDFVQFDPCYAAGLEHEIPSKFGSDYMPLLKGHFYDYTSQMHYQCGWCPGGFPKMDGVSKCGSDAQPGLSVMDADKFNDFYNCQGCYRHRWVRFDDFHDPDLNVPVFGQTVGGAPVYLCRTYVNGEMTPGKYRMDQNVCYVGFNGREYGVSRNVQVFTYPRVQRSVDTTQYTTFQVNSTKSAGIYQRNNFIPVGSTNDGRVIYAATATIQGEKAIGKVYENNMGQVLVPYGGAEYTLTNFEIIGCQ